MKICMMILQTPLIVKQRVQKQISILKKIKDCNVQQQYNPDFYPEKILFDMSPVRMKANITIFHYRANLLGCTLFHESNNSCGTNLSSIMRYDEICFRKFFLFQFGM